MSTLSMDLACDTAVEGTPYFTPRLLDTPRLAALPELTWSPMSTEADLGEMFESVCNDKRASLLFYDALENLSPILSPIEGTSLRSVPLTIFETDTDTDSIMSCSNSSTSSFEHISPSSVAHSLPCAPTDGIPLLEATLLSPTAPSTMRRMLSKLALNASPSTSPKHVNPQKNRTARAMWPFGQTRDTPTSPTSACPPSDSPGSD